MIYQVVTGLQVWPNMRIIWRTWNSKLVLYTVYDRKGFCAWALCWERNAELSMFTVLASQSWLINTVLTFPFSISISLFLLCLPPFNALLHLRLLPVAPSLFFPPLSLLFPLHLSGCTLASLRAINLWSVPSPLNPVWRGSWQADKYQPQQHCSSITHLFSMNYNNYSLLFFLYST